MHDPLEETAVVASKEQTVEVVGTKTVDFYGDIIPAAQAGDGDVYVPIRALSLFLGLEPNAQNQRARRDRVLSRRLRSVEIDTGGGPQKVLCLPLQLIPGWLFGITTGKMGPELQHKLDIYRDECFDVLWRAFRDDIQPAVSQQISLTPAEQNLQQTEALYKLAQQQVELERQYRVMADYTKGFIRDTRGHLTTHDTALAEHEQRLVSIELRLDPAANITDAQAAEIALAVKNVAFAMEERGSSGGYGKIYSEMYRRYRISSYKNLPGAKYDEVIAWLGRWFEDITKGKPAEVLATYP